MRDRISYAMKKVDLHKLEKLKSFFIKSIIAISIILVVMFLKKINLRQTNSFLDTMKTSTEYKFNFYTDGKKVFGRMQNLLENSIETLNVYNPIAKVAEEKLPLPVEGTLYRAYEEGTNNGIDIRVMEDKEPLSIIDGVVSKVEQRDKRGYFITIESEDMELVYGYLAQTHLAKGDKISTGDGVGVLGTNKDGFKYLRLEIWENSSPVDPLNYISMK